MLSQVFTDRPLVAKHWILFNFCLSRHNIAPPPLRVSIATSNERLVKELAEMSAMNRKLIQNLAETLCKQVKHCRYLLTNVFLPMSVNCILYNIVIIAAVHYRDMSCIIKPELQQIPCLVTVQSFDSIVTVL